MSDDSRGSNDAIVSLLAGIGVGVLLGAVAALLLAPQAGEHTRAQIKDTADDAIGRLRESKESLRSKVEEVAASTRDAVQSRIGSTPDASQGTQTGANEGEAAPAG